MNGRGGPAAAAGLILLISATASAQHLASISFDDAVRAVLTRNAAARIADDEIARAEALVVEARGTWLPIVGAQAAYTRIEADRTVGGRVTSAADSFAAQVSVSV